MASIIVNSKYVWLVTMYSLWAVGRNISRAVSISRSSLFLNRTTAITSFPFRWHQMTEFSVIVLLCVQVGSALCLATTWITAVVDSFLHWSLHIRSQPFLVREPWRSSFKSDWFRCRIFVSNRKWSIRINDVVHVKFNYQQSRECIQSENKWIKLYNTDEWTEQIIRFNFIRSQSYDFYEYLVQRLFKFDCRDSRNVQIFHDDTTERRLYYDI